MLKILLATLIATTPYQHCLVDSERTDNAIAVCILDHMHNDQEAMTDYCDWLFKEDPNCKEDTND